MSHEERVSSHYDIPELGRRILDALRASGKRLDRLGVDDLAPVDAFHVRGRTATQELLELADVRKDDTVLDVGCGIGGTCRYIATSTGCRTTGIDLTDTYCRVADMLSERVGLSGRTTFLQASALDLPFNDASFDIVWTEHAQMNIADKDRFYAEIARVLRPGGQFVFHDIFAGPGGEPHFPVPWADARGLSHLAGVDTVAALLDGLGLVKTEWKDTSQLGATFFEDMMRRVEKEGWQWLPVGLHLLMDDATVKFGNMGRNLRDNRIRLVQAVCRKRAA